MIISLQDNQYKAVPWDKAIQSENEEKSASPLSQLEKDTLQKFNRVALENLDKSNLIIFPSDSVKKELGDKEFIFKLDDKNSDTPGFLTGNVMGFFSLGAGVQMQITSRFDQNGKNFFLHYMLQKVCNVAFVPKETDSAEDEFFDLLYYLFPLYLNDACAQGIYRAYVTREYNDANVRGPIDVARHIRYNIPFNGKIAYHTREYTTDNSMTQLIRHTIEYIRTLPCGSSILENGEKTRDNVNAVIDATPTYSRNAWQKIIADNLRTAVHPYYTAYEPLRKICLAILCHQKLSYGNSDDNSIAGILFDGASLWEEYLAKVFTEYNLNLTHSNNRTKDEGIQIFEGGQRYFPDFYRKNSSEESKDGIILDAKYKKLCVTPDENYDDEDEDDSAETSDDNKFTFHFRRDDLFQMLTYMYSLKVETAKLICPCKVNSSEPRTKKKELVKSGYGGDISIFAVPIPQNVDKWDVFTEKMKEIEKAFCGRIENSTMLKQRNLTH